MSGQGAERGKAALETLPAVQFIGAASKIDAQRHVLVKDKESWNTLWSEHTRSKSSLIPPTRFDAPKIDFSRYMVAGVFKGASTNSDGEVCLSVLDSPDAVRVRFRTSTFQTASIGAGEDQGVKATCYGMWVIEKSDKAVVLEQAIQGLKADPLRWQEVKRFEEK